MNIYRHCGQLVHCPNCKALNEITLDDCSELKNSGEAFKHCDICGGLFKMIYTNQQVIYVLEKDAKL